ncbi:MAG: hypothetical protein NVS3B26_24880 [Mycobacteriales bacterium]
MHPDRPQVSYPRRMEDLLSRCAHAGLPVAPASDAAVHAGSVSLRHGTVVDVVLAREVTVAARAAGAEDRQLLVPRLRRGRRPHRGADRWRTPLPPWGMRLSRVLRAVRRTLGDADLLVTWADDGHRCRLVAVRRA